MDTPGRIAELERKFGDNPRRYFAALANEYRKAGQLDKAVELCEEHLAEQRNHLSGHVVLAQALVDSGRPEAAWSSLHTALDLDPENFIALRLLGDLSASAGDADQARAYYFRALEIEPRNEQLLTALKSLGQRAAASEPATSELATSELATSELATSELATSELATSELATSELATSEAAASESGAREPAADQTDSETTPPLGFETTSLAVEEPEAPAPAADDSELESIPTLADEAALAAEPVAESLPEPLSDPGAELEETLEARAAEEEARTASEQWPSWESPAPTEPAELPSQYEAADEAVGELQDAAEWWQRPQAETAEPEAEPYQAESREPEEPEPGQHESVSARLEEPEPELSEPEPLEPELSEPEPAVPEPGLEQPETRTTPSVPLVSETMVGLYLSQGHTALAIAALRDLVEARPDDERLRARLDDLERITPRERRETVRDLFARLGRPRATTTPPAPRGRESPLDSLFNDAGADSAVEDPAIAAALAGDSQHGTSADFERWLTELRNQ